jgi:YD repeat-containing protein
MGTSSDGKAVCTAPTLRGYTYQLCSSSLLIIALAEEARCYAQVVGGQGNPIRSESTLQSIISCMRGGGAPSWMPAGAANGFYCGGAVAYKYGDQVNGVSLELPYPYGHLQPKRYKTAVCPTGYQAVGPDSNLPDYCKKPTKYCCDTTPNPMGVANADHGRIERDIPASGNSPLELTRYYSSSAYYRPVGAANPSTVATAAILNLNLEWNLTPGFGDFWRHTYERRILPENSAYLMATASRPNGTNKHFRLDGSLVINEDGRADRLIKLTDAQANLTGWRYFSDEGVETYAPTGELLSIKTRAGRTITLLYSAAVPGQTAGLLAEVNDDAGRYLRFSYDSKLRIAAVTDSAGHTLTYSYFNDTQFGGLMLGGVTYPGGASRSYTYGDDPLGRNGGEFGLTGIYDEFGVRLASYGYGGAAYVEYSGGTSRYQRTAVSATQVSIADPLGTSRVHTLQTVAGVPRIAGVSQPAGFGSAAASSARSYDAAGNLASNDDFDGRRTCYANDAARLVELVRVEGLTNATACSGVLAVGATLPAPARKISTQWHPDWRLPVRTAGPGRLTTYVYNGQPDPTAGNVVVTCAPAAAQLPDGKPIAVVCARVEQATLSVDGSQGFAAALDTTVPQRRWSYTYNERGQVLTAIDPRNSTMSYSYYTATSATSHVGDLQSTTNAAGHITTYDSYTATGLLLQSTDANGTVTATAYDARRRPTSISVTAGGVTQTTSYVYDPAGKIKQVTLPDGKSVVSTYDVAQRLVGVTDAAGNTVTYTLDEAGNRIGEQVKDPSGNLARNVARAFDALSRAYAVYGATQ